MTEGEGGARPPATELRTFLIADVRGYTTYTREFGDEAAAANELAERMATQDVPVVAYGENLGGQYLSPDLGCRVFQPFGWGIDLAALCLE